MEDLIAKFQALQADLIRVSLAEAERLGHQKDLFYTFMNNLPALAMLKDEQGQYVFVNNALQDLIGLPYTELVGKSEFGVWPEENLDDEFIRLEMKTVNYVKGKRKDRWLVCKFPIEMGLGKIYIGVIATKFPG